VILQRTRTSRRRSFFVFFSVFCFPFPCGADFLGGHCRFPRFAREMWFFFLPSFVSFFFFFKFYCLHFHKTKLKRGSHNKHNNNDNKQPASVSRVEIKPTPPQKNKKKRTNKHTHIAGRTATKHQPTNKGNTVVRSTGQTTTTKSQTHVLFFLVLPPAFRSFNASFSARLPTPRRCTLASSSHCSGILAAKSTRRPAASA